MSLDYWQADTSVGRFHGFESLRLMSREISSDVEKATNPSNAGFVLRRLLMRHPRLVGG